MSKKIIQFKIKALLETKTPAASPQNPKNQERSPIENVWGFASGRPALAMSGLRPSMARRDDPRSKPQTFSPGSLVSLVKFGWVFYGFLCKKHFNTA